MATMREKLSAFLHHRWVVFTAATWIQSCAGTGYMFGSISPAIKSALSYNQKQIATLAVAKDLGGSLGFLAGGLCEVLPLWGCLLVGALQSCFAYGWLWLIVTTGAPALPIWAMFVLIFMCSNGETYYNTANLVSCVQNFPSYRGPVVGILKGFAGLSGAILTQIYTIIHAPNQASLIFMIAVGPSMVVISLMYFIRPVAGHTQIKSSDGTRFSFIFSLCLVLAAYLMGVMLVEDLVIISHSVIVIFTVILVILLLTPVLIPISLTFSEVSQDPIEASLLANSENLEYSEHKQNVDKGLCGDGSDEKATETDFTLMQILVSADFWLIFFSLLLGSGSGLMVIDNLGQISQSLGYDNTHIFVSLISIWNFLGRIGGGYFSEIIVRDKTYPRLLALAVAQVLMALGHFFIGMGWAGAMYIGTLLIGVGYGAHWAIVPAAASELFGLKKFGALYNILNVANPAGSLIFSGLIASTIYDMEAEKQSHHKHYPVQILESILSAGISSDEPLKCEGAICFFLTSMIMSGFCIVAAVLSTVLVYRTRVIYVHLYEKIPPQLFLREP